MHQPTSCHPRHGRIHQDYGAEDHDDPHDLHAGEALSKEHHAQYRRKGRFDRSNLNGETLGDRIRRPEISMAASDVSAIPCVRSFLLETQRGIARRNSVVMDGRDIGTVILPDADVKIFMVASDEARALRRTRELQDKGMTVNYEDVLREMRERDAQDSGRAIAPAVPAADAIHLDNSDMTVEQSVEAVLAIVEQCACKS